MKDRSIALQAAAALVMFVWLANAMTHTFGMIPAGFGLITTAGTYAAGLTFVLRDLIQEFGNWKWSLAAVTIGALITGLTASPALGLASGVTFLLAEALDQGLYTRLRRRGLILAMLGSSVIGALVDSILFLYLAGFPVTFTTVAGQMLVKTYVIGGMVLLLRVVSMRRVVPGQRQ